jgi:hypothetical protein
MRSLTLLALPLFIVAAQADAARSVKVIEPLAPGIAGAAHVTATSIMIGDTAKPIYTHLDEKAAAKRQDAKLPPYDGATRPAKDSYATLPFVTMMPLAVDDVTRDWDLLSGRAVKLAITIDTIKTADAAAGLLLSSADELAGTVDVIDATDGTRLGEFYVDVLNFHGGPLGMALRGSGVREKLAEEFAKHIAEQLSGSKHKPTTVSKT